MAAISSLNKIFYIRKSRNHEKYEIHRKNEEKTSRFE